MHAHTAVTTSWIALALLTLVVVSLAVLPIAVRCATLKRQSQEAQDKASRRMRETDDVTDQLLQGVQGLLLTFHVAAQKLGNDHVSRKLMDHALLEADELVSAGRRRFENVAFASEPDAILEEGGGPMYSARSTYLAESGRREERP